MEGRPHLGSATTTAPLLVPARLERWQLIADDPRHNNLDPMATHITAYGHALIGGNFYRANSKHSFLKRLGIHLDPTPKWERIAAEDVR